VNSIQRAVFPAILISSLVLGGITRLIASPQITVIAATVPPVAAEPAQAEATDDAVEAAAEAQAQSGIEAVAGQPAGNANECSLPSSYPESIRQWCGWIQRYAAEVELDPRLIAAVMLQESGGKADAYSHSGAVGLMQVMPRDGLAEQFMCSGRPCFASRPSMDELFEPEYNISYGTRMLAGLVARHGNVRDALKAYGPMDMGYRYADIVLSIYENYQ
jgi:soluble lytic murein transglycosylase-like protein